MLRRTIAVVLLVLVGGSPALAAPHCFPGMDTRHVLDMDWNCQVDVWDTVTFYELKFDLYKVKPKGKRSRPKAWNNYKDEFGVPNISEVLDLVDDNKFDMSDYYKYIELLRALEAEHGLPYVYHPGASAAQLAVALPASSSLAIPEPSSLPLLLFGGAALCVRSLRR